MARIEPDQHQQCMQRFIDLANTMKEEGVGTNVVSAGLMTASCVYATYVVGGNDGALAPSGVDKVAAAYKQQLEQIQEVKKAQHEQAKKS